MNTRLKSELLSIALLLTGNGLLKAQYVDEVWVDKTENFLQVSAAAPTAHATPGSPGGVFNFSAQVEGNGLNAFAGFKLTLPNSTQVNLADEYPSYHDFFGLSADYATKSAMDAAYPSGTYTFSTGSSSIPSSLGTMDQYPTDIPMITNGTWDAQGNLVINASAGATLNFNAYTGYAPNPSYSTFAGGEITFDLYTVSGGQLTGYVGGNASMTLSGVFNDPAMTSYTISPGVLQAGQTYYAEIGFFRIISVNQGNQAFQSALSVPYFGYFTGFLITTGPAATAPTAGILPLSQTVPTGHGVTFTSTVGGSPTPALQWRKNNVDIAGATSGTLTIAHAAAGDAGTYTLYASNSAGSTTSNSAVLTVTPPPPVTLGADFNADGQTDIVWSNTATGDRAIWFLNGTALSSFGYLAGIPTDWHIVGTGDFDGDGQTDLVWENVVSGDRTLWLMNGTSIASFAYLAYVDPVWHIAAVGDFNGDHKADLLWENTVTGDRTVWFLNGTGIGSFGYLAGIPTDWRIAGAGDFNGDGQTDIIWENSSTGDRSVWLMAGTTISSFVAVANVAPAWHIAAVADYNGDGQPDLLWENTVSGDRAIWLMNGTSQASAPYLAFVDPVWRMAP